MADRDRLGRPGSRAKAAAARFRCRPGRGISWRPPAYSLLTSCLCSVRYWHFQCFSMAFIATISTVMDLLHVLCACKTYVFLTPTAESCSSFTGEWIIEDIGPCLGPCLYHVARRLLRCWRFRRACHVELPTIEDHSFTTNVDFHLNLDRSTDTVRRRQWRTFDSMTSLRTCVNLSCYVIHQLTAIVWLLATTAHRRRVLINVRRWWLSSHVLKARLHGMIDCATKPKSRLVA